MPDAPTLLSPRLDIVFKLLLQSNLALVQSMIEAVVSLPAPIERLEILNPEIPRDLAADKCIELDVRVSLVDQARFDIEMQTQVPKWVTKRFLYYLARELSSTIHRGGAYQGIVPVYSILWLNENLFPYDHFHGVFHLSEDSTHTRFCSDLEIHTLELPKLHLLQPADNPALYRWSRFLLASTHDEFETLAAEDPTMSLAKEALESVSADPHAQNLAREREESFYLYHESLRWERQLGEASGEARGQARSVLEVLEIRGLPVSPTQREQLLSCTDTQTLTTWLKRAITVTSADELFTQ